MEPIGDGVACQGEAVVDGLEEERDPLRQQVCGPEPVGEKLGEREEVGGGAGDVWFPGDEDADFGGGSELLQELAAVAAGGGGDGEEEEGGLGVEGEVGEEELLGVDGVVEGEAGELDVDAEEDPAGGAQADGYHGEVGDGWAGEGLGWPEKGREEVHDRGQTQPFRHGFGLGSLDYKLGPIHFNLKLLPSSSE